ncbi:MAG: hypothetical protein GY820_06225 [Gammaproteobacteria bacterium]|nr:hypothetical protein [Gammaproteobacteria bacterium]
MNSSTEIDQYITTVRNFAEKLSRQQKKNTVPPIMNLLKKTVDAYFWNIPVLLISGAIFQCKVYTSEVDAQALALVHFAGPYTFCGSFQLLRVQ